MSSGWTALARGGRKAPRLGGVSMEKKGGTSETPKCVNLGAGKAKALKIS